MGEVFTEVFVRPIINVLVLMYQGLSLLHIPYPLGFSIILLTVVIRFLLYPLTHSQLKASKKMQELSPHLSKIKDRHKGDNQRIQQETMRLYKEHGVNPAAGCLPVIIQLPVIWSLYSVLQQIVDPNMKKVLSYVNVHTYDIDFLKLTRGIDQTFFGIPLGQHPSQLMSIMPFIILIPVATGVFQFLQTKMMMSQNARAKQSPLEKKKDGHEDFAAAFQTQSLYIFPAMIGFFSYSFPIGLSLYWNTFTVFGILQQYRIYGLGGLREWKEKLILWTKKKSR